MSLMLDAARVAATVNIVLLLVLIALWARLYRQVRSQFTLGSIVFAGFLLAENAVALWYYLSAPSLTPGLLSVPVAVQVMMVLQILEVFGIATLLYITWQ